MVYKPLISFCIGTPYIYNSSILAEWSILFNQNLTCKPFSKVVY